MKILIAYYSRSGHTRRVALDIAKKLTADVDEIIDLKNRSGIIGWVMGGRDAMKENLTQIKTSKNPADYDLVIVGTPVWASNSTPAVRAYLTNFKKDLPQVAIYNTSGGTSPQKTVDSLEGILGKKVVAFAGWSTAELNDAAVYQSKLDQFAAEISKQ